VVYEGMCTDDRAGIEIWPGVSLAGREEEGVAGCRPEPGFIKNY
jgi:hypothetical protein